MPPASGTYQISLELQLRAAAAADQRRPGRLDDILGAMECAMLDIVGAKSAINNEPRPADYYTLYDIEPTVISIDTEGSDWIDTREYLLTVAFANS